MNVALRVRFECILNAPDGPTGGQEVRSLRFFIEQTQLNDCE